MSKAFAVRRHRAVSGRGKRFIYHAGMPGARVFTAKEAAEKQPRLRFYFPAGHALSRK
jgi:hypothetical protein